METNKVNEETPRDRCVRIGHGPINLFTVVTFNVTPFRGGYVFRTQQRGHYGVFKFSCKKVQELFVSLLAPYPEYLERTNHIENSVHCPSDQPIRDFASMIVDSNPKQGQEPFIFVQLLDADYPHPDPKKIGKYFRNLDHFITTFLNN